MFISFELLFVSFGYNTLLTLWTQIFRRQKLLKTSQVTVGQLASSSNAYEIFHRHHTPAFVPQETTEPNLIVAVQYQTAKS